MMLMPHSFIAKLAMICIQLLEKRFYLLADHDNCRCCCCSSNARYGEEVCQSLQVRADLSVEDGLDNVVRRRSFVTRCKEIPDQILLLLSSIPLDARKLGLNVNHIQFTRCLKFSLVEGQKGFICRSPSS